MKVEDILKHEAKRILAAQKAEEDLANYYRTVEEGLSHMFTPGDKFNNFIEKLRGEAEARKKSIESTLNTCQAGRKELKGLSNPMLTPGVDFVVRAIEFPRKTEGVSIKIEKLIINVGDSQPKTEKGE